MKTIFHVDENTKLMNQEGQPITRNLKPEKSSGNCRIPKTERFKISQTEKTEYL